MNKLLKLLQQCWVERAGPIPWPGRSCGFTLLDIFWSNVTEHMYLYIHGVSRLVGITAWGDFLGLFDQKSSHKHVSNFGQLRNYGHFFNSRTRPHVNRILRSQLAGDVLNLVAYHLHCKQYLPPDSPTQLQTVQFPYLEIWKVFKEFTEVGWVGIRLARVYCMSQLLLRVQTPLSLTLQSLCRLLMFRTVRW